MNLWKVEKGESLLFKLLYTLFRGVRVCYTILDIYDAHLSIRFRDVLGQLDAAMPQAITVTPEEREAIERVSSHFSVKKNTSS